MGEGRGGGGDCRQQRLRVPPPPRPLPPREGEWQGIPQSCTLPQRIIRQPNEPKPSLPELRYRFDYAICGAAFRVVHVEDYDIAGRGREECSSYLFTAEGRTGIPQN